MSVSSDGRQRGRQIPCADRPISSAEGSFDNSDSWQSTRRPCRHSARVLLPFLLLLTGCGNSFDALVEGEVTLDGTRLDTGTVAFHPVQGGPAAYGSIQADGRFTIATGSRQGLPPGEYIVTVVATAPPPDRKLDVPGKLLTPARYGQLDRSGLRFTVVRGRNHFELPLTSTVPKP